MPSDTSGEGRSPSSFTATTPQSSAAAPRTPETQLTLPPPCEPLPPKTSPGTEVEYRAALRFGRITRIQFNVGRHDAAAARQRMPRRELLRSQSSSATIRYLTPRASRPSTEAAH